VDNSSRLIRPIHPWVAAGRDKIRFAIVGGSFPDWARTVEFVQQAEELGFDAYWANDHPTRALD
jgi:alkanesulfonate monooxygenase SsuD/methylene tetrahydromethanopterin reductase-like flavin-dependent oxidoreductase (luciferase family)